MSLRLNRRKAYFSLNHEHSSGVTPKVCKCFSLSKSLAVRWVGSAAPEILGREIESPEVEVPNLD